MSKYTDKVRAEFHGKSWAFIDPDNADRNVKFDQALIDATWVGPGVVEGYVKSVHGVALEDLQYMNNRSKLAIGVTSNHRLGLESFRRVRLNEDGSSVWVNHE